MIRRIGDIVGDVKKKLLRESTKKALAVEQHWDKIVGAQTAARTSVQGLKQKILYVKVQSPALMNELANFKKDAILLKIQERCRNGKGKPTRQRGFCLFGR